MTSGRVDSIDFWRGVVLAVIFINHIPGNVLGNFTPRNFGFSDAAEAFVFLSGFSVALAFGGRFQAGSGFQAFRPFLQRAIRLYAAHIVLTASALALFGLATFLTGQETLLSEHGRSTPFVDPVRGFFGLIILSHQVGYFNILPLYIALLCLAPLLLLVGLRSRWQMLLVSAGLYAITRASGFNFPLWPDTGDWFFNPMAWQFMFAVGIFVGLSIRHGDLPVHLGLYRLAFVFTCASAVVVSNLFGLAPGLVEAAGERLDWGKTELGVVRIIDFLALAYMLYCSGLSTRLRSTSTYWTFSVLGRHALPVFCIGSLLSAVGQIINETAISSPLFDVVFVSLGLWMLYRIASFLEWKRRAVAVALESALSSSPQADALSCKL